jgi:uncharacterized small protein (DUF1192 family)
MKNRFEQLIEYVINDEEQKARELFHQIVVEKSREIYESLMSEEDDAMGRMDRYDEALGGDQSDDLIADVEIDEEGLSEEDDSEDMDISVDMDDETDMDMGDEDSDMDMGDEDSDMDGEVEDRVEDLEDRIIDLEDEIDRLIAEFDGKNNDMMDTEEVIDDEMETEGMMKMPMEEAISLKAAPKPVTSEEGSVNKHSTVAANSGSRGAMAHPVKMTGDTAQGRPAPTTKDLIGRVQNTPAQGSVKQEAAPKPHLAQATGVNTKTPFPKS